MEGGLARIDPISATRSLAGPPIHVQQLSTPRRSIALPRVETNGPILQLPAGAQDLLRIDYAGICFTQPEQLRYQYRLRGSSDSWVDVGTQRQAWFAHLPPGEYQFEVKAYDFRDTVSREPASLSFVIRYHYYQTWWFRAAVGMVLLAVVLGVHRYRLSVRARINALQKKLEIEEERSRIARDMHDEIGTSLAQIRMLGELAQSDSDPDDSQPSPTARRTRQIAGLAQTCSQSLREIIWSLSPSRNSADDLIDFLRHYVEQAFADSQIESTFTVKGAALPPTHEFSPTTRRQLVLMLKGIVSNVQKHSHATQFHLQITTDRDSIILEAYDNGIGFDQKVTPPDSLGLLALQERADELHAQFTLTTSPGQGTRIRIQLPVQGW
ncbi:MAG: histidine kinase [Verrucomicrobiales bacterium]